MAALITVRAPQPVTEVVCGVPFVEGVAEVDPAVDGQRRALLYFTQAGYGIEKPEAASPDQPADEPAPTAEESSAKPAPRGAKKES